MTTAAMAASGTASAMLWYRVTRCTMNGATSIGSGTPLNARTMTMAAKNNLPFTAPTPEVAEGISRWIEELINNKVNPKKSKS